MRVVEAMACWVPVVATAVNSVPESSSPAARACLRDRPIPTRSVRLRSCSTTRDAAGMAAAARGPRRDHSAPGDARDMTSTEAYDPRAAETRRRWPRACAGLDHGLRSKRRENGSTRLLSWPGSQSCSTKLQATGFAPTPGVDVSAEVTVEKSRSPFAIAGGPCHARRVCAAAAESCSRTFARPGSTFTCAARDAGVGVHLPMASAAVERVAAIAL